MSKPVSVIMGHYHERGSLPGTELDDWLQAEHELDGRASQRGESTDLDGHEP